MSFYYYRYWLFRITAISLASVITQTALLCNHRHLAVGLAIITELFSASAGCDLRGGMGCSPVSRPTMIFTYASKDSDFWIQVSPIPRPSVVPGSPILGP